MACNNAAFLFVSGGGAGQRGHAYLIIGAASNKGTRLFVCVGDKQQGTRLFRLGGCRGKGAFGQDMMCPAEARKKILSRIPMRSLHFVSDCLTSPDIDVTQGQR